MTAGASRIFKPQLQLLVSRARHYQLVAHMQRSCWKRRDHLHRCRSRSPVFGGGIQTSIDHSATRNFQQEHYPSHAHTRLSGGARRRPGACRPREHEVLWD
ncbi:unnamed protein product [Ectocarpus sp. 12 AP-2014]